MVEEIQMNFFIWVDLIGWIFLLRLHAGETLANLRECKHLSEDQIFTPTPNPRIPYKGFSVCKHVSRIEILTKENLLSGKKLLPLQFPGRSLP